MSPAPVLESFSSELHERLSPLAYADEENGWALAILLAAIGTMFQDIEDLARDTDAGVGWSPLLSADRTPIFALEWLGQLAGVRIPPRPVTESDEDYSTRARDRIKSTDGFKRGSPAALRGAAGQFLTGTKTALIRERDSSAYNLTVTTYAEETPDPDAVLRALLEQKPAGLVLDYVVSSGYTYAIVIASYDDYAEVASTFATYQDLTDNTP